MITIERERKKKESALKRQACTWLTFALESNTSIAKRREEWLIEAYEVMQYISTHMQLKGMHL